MVHEGLAEAEKSAENLRSDIRQEEKPGFALLVTAIRSECKYTTVPRQVCLNVMCEKL